MADPPPSGARRASRLPVRAAPWLAMLAMAAFWPRRKSRRFTDSARPAALTPEAIDAAEPGRGRNANFPWTIPALGWKDILWRTYREMGRNRLPALAGGVTFYLLLATFPAIAAFVSLYGLFLDVDTVERQLAHLSAFLPRDAVTLIGEQMVRLANQRHGALGAAFVASTLVSVWSANAGMRALFDGVNITYDEAEKRPYLHRTVITYGATLAGLVFLAGTTVAGVAGPAVVQRLGLHGWEALRTPLRWVVVYLTAAVAFTLIYRYGPSRERAKWRWVVSGGFAAAAIGMAGSLGFSWYINSFTHFGVTYGSLGAMIGFMLWVWFSVMLILLGAELNAEIEHQTACDTTTGEPAPIGARGAAMADSVGKAFTVSPREARHIVSDFLRRQVNSVVGFWRRLVGN